MKRNIVIIFIFGLMLKGNSQDLQMYLAEAEANNPNISVFEYRTEAAEEKVEEVNTYPDTEFGVGYFVSEPETRTGAQRVRVSVKQMLPWFGTISTRQEYAGTVAEATTVEVAVEKRKLQLAVSQSYYTIYNLKEKLEVLQRNIDLLETYEQLALTSVEVGSASAVDVLRLQIRQNELEQKINEVSEDLSAAYVSFNTLLNRRESAEVTIVDSLLIPSEELLPDISALKMHPELLKYDRMYESIAQAEFLNQKEASPRFGVGIDYVLVSERPDMDFSDNGKDIIMPMVSLSVPIFNKRYRSVSRQNEIKQQELLAQREDRENILYAMLQTAVKKRNAARFQYETALKNLFRTRQAEEILMKNYETGTIDFNDLLEVQELQLKLETELINSVSEFYRQSAVINYIVRE